MPVPQRINFLVGWASRPPATVQPVHDRMPVILPASDWEEWLDPSIKNAQEVLPLLKPYASAAMIANAVSAIVNSPTRDSPECIQAKDI